MGMWCMSKSLKVTHWFSINDKITKPAISAYGFYFFSTFQDLLDNKIAKRRGT